LPRSAQLTEHAVRPRARRVLARIAAARQVRARDQRHAVPRQIGDLRLDLRRSCCAIQEGEIERVGGAKPIKTEFRLIAATTSISRRP
jgi:transcriptional regulator of acetoin/glycerol metabolism